MKDCPDNPWRALQELRRRALEHWLTLDEGGAARWLDQHGLLSLAILTETTGETTAPPVPEQRGRILQRQRRRALAANLHRMERFQALTAALHERGIPCCPLKGIHLLDTVYRDDPEHRPMADVDVLVPASALADAVSTLEDELGLTETALSRELAADSHERILAAPGLVVEVHRHLGLRSGRRVDWRMLEDQDLLHPGRLLDRPVHRLAPCALAVHLLSHFVQHGPWSRLVRAEDLLRLALKFTDPIEGHADPLAVARRWGVATRVIAGRRALQSTLDFDPLPDLPRQAPGMGRLGTWIWERLMVSGERVFRGTTSGRWRRNAGLVLLADNLSKVPSLILRRRREGGRHRVLPKGRKAV